MKVLNSELGILYLKPIKIKNLLLFLTYLIVILTFFSTSLIISGEKVALTGILLLIALFLEYRKKYLPRILVNFLAIFIVLLFILHLNFQSFLIDSITTLLQLISIKLLEEKKARDYFEIYLLSYLTLAGCSFFYAHFTFFVFLILMLFLINSCLFLTLYEKEENFTLNFLQLRKIFFIINLLPLLALILSFLFFYTLPRLQAPIFNFGLTSNKAKTGFTDKILLGSFSFIQESSQIVARVEMPQIPKNLLYWRVIIFDHFDGKIWSTSSNLIYRFSSNFIQKNLKKHGIKGIYYLQIDHNGYLLTLDKPKRLITSLPVTKFSGFIYKLRIPQSYPIKYYVVSDLSENIKEILSEEDKKNYLQIPKLSPKIFELAKKLKRETPKKTALAIYEFLTKKGGFKYTLENLPKSDNPLETFLFETKKGNCEYFSTAMAILLRLNGIPARIIGGYKGGEYQEIGHYYIIREKNAHSWVEAYLNGAWFRFDPVPFINKDFYKLSLWERFLKKIDIINFYYYKFILNYNFSAQKKLFHTIKSNFKISLKLHSYKKFFKIVVLLSFIFFLIIIFSFYAFKPLIYKFFLSKEKYMLIKFLNILENKGYLKKEEEGLEEFVNKIKEPNIKNLAYEFVKIWESYYYKDKKLDENGEKKLKNLIKQLKTNKNRC